MRKLLLSISSTALLVITGCGGGSESQARGTQEATSLTHGNIVSQPASNTGIRGKVMATTQINLPNAVPLRREPLQGAELAIFRNGENQEAARVFSDALGEFSIELPPGNYVLVPRLKELGDDILIAPSQILPLIPGDITPVQVEYESVSLQPR